MFKGFNNRQQNSFPNINFGGNYGQAYNFSRCLLWLDAAYGTNTVVNGANVSLWQDKINGVQYTQATAGSQPTYVASDASFNNLPTLNFGDNVARRLAGSTSLPLGNSTLAIIVRNTNILRLVGNLIIGDGFTSGFFGGGAGADVSGFGYYTSATGFTRSNIEDTNMHIVISNANFIIVDGINRTTNTTSVGLNFSHIGSNQGFNYNTSCVIGEILLYDYIMSETDAIQLSSNINAKYLKY